MPYLDDITVRYQVYLERLKTSDYREFNKVLTELVPILEKELGGREVSELSKRKLQDLVKKVTSKYADSVDEAVEVLVASMKELAEYAYDFEKDALLAGTTIPKLSVGSSASAIWKRAMEHPLSVDGGLLDDWLEKLTDVQIVATENMIRRAAAEGWSTRTMLQAFRGTRANRFTDGLVPKLGRSNETVIRTAIQHVSSTARLKLWEDNDDVVKGYRWVATLDEKTTSECRSLDGQEFQLGKGPTPPGHRSCRSTTVPVLDKTFKILERGATRASATGPVPQRQSYYQWLKNQSANFQDSVIGPTRGKLLRDGGLTAEEFSRLQLNRIFEPLTLDEMRRLKPLAFEKAGI